MAEALPAFDEARSAAAALDASGEPIETRFTPLHLERRYLWTARGFAMMCAVQASLTLVMFLALAEIGARSPYRPYYVNFAVADPPVQRRRTVSSYDEDLFLLLVEQTVVRRYVLLRESVVPDVVEMERRWRDTDGIVSTMSTPGVFREFRRTIADPTVDVLEDPDAAFERFVNIRSSANTSADLSAWRVEYEVSQQAAEPDAIPEIRCYEVDLLVEYDPGRFEEKTAYEVSFGGMTFDRLEVNPAWQTNPLGFTIAEYGPPREITQATENCGEGLTMRGANR